MERPSILFYLSALSLAFILGFLWAAGMSSSLFFLFLLVLLYLI